MLDPVDSYKTVLVKIVTITLSWKFWRPY